MEKPAKSKIRETAKLIRAGITDNYLANSSIKISKSLIDFAEKNQFKQIISYYPFNKEVNITNFNEYILNSDRELFLPKINGNEMEFYKIDGINNLQLNTYGIYEPADIDCVKTREFTELIRNQRYQISSADSRRAETNVEISLAVCPGLAFDLSGRRIGYGKGYYDKFFNNCRQLNICIYKIGVCLNTNLFDKLPVSDYDISMDCIITENQTIQLKSIAG